MPNWHLNHLLEIRKQLVMLLFSFIVGSVLSVIICPYLIFNPTDINYFAMMGAKTSISSNTIRNRQKNFTIPEENQ